MIKFLINKLKEKILCLNEQRRYLHLSAKVFKFRQENPNAEDPDELLDAMDSPWYSMNSLARSQVQRELTEAMKSKDEEIKFIEKYS